MSFLREPMDVFFLFLWATPLYSIRLMGKWRMS